MAARGGMTLMEVVVALAIAGLVTSLGYAAVGGVVDATQRSLAATSATVSAASRRAMLVRWLEGARLDVQPANPPFRGLDGVREGQADDELAFLTSTPTPVSQHVTSVVLFVDRDSATAEEGLVAELVAHRGKRSLRLVLEPAAAGLDCRYFTRMLDAGRWLPGWISNTVLPLAVELTLEGEPGESLPPLLRPPILAILEPGR